MAKALPKEVKEAKALLSDINKSFNGLKLKQKINKLKKIADKIENMDTDVSDKLFENLVYSYEGIEHIHSEIEFMKQEKIYKI